MEKKQRIERKIKKLALYQEYIIKRHILQNKILINKLKKLSEYFFNESEISAIVIMILYNEKGIFNQDFYSWKNYFDYSERNKLIALQAMNKYANMNKIRVEDSIDIFREKIFSIINKEDYYLVGEDDEIEEEDTNIKYGNYEIDKKINEIIEGEGINDYKELEDYL